jgi:hypothetical protein
MATRRSKTEGLTSEDVAALRQQLADGRRPRVQLSGPQFPPGSAGTVSRIGDPETAGTDYITVRVKVNGVTDELAFAPVELSLRSRATRTAGSTRAANARSSTARSTGRRPAKAARPAAAPSTPALAASSAPSQPVPPQPAPSDQGPAPVGAMKAARTAKAAGTVATASRRRKAGVAPKVSFTVTSAGANWAVSASRGAKGIAKNLAVPPGVITAIAELLDQPALIEAVAEINNSALSEAQARAEQLRAELDQLEAVLAAHRSPR